MFGKKKMPYFIFLICAIGGLLIGLVAGTNISPVHVIIFGALLIFLIFVLIKFLNEDRKCD
jgi:hypothetical protein